MSDLAGLIERCETHFWLELREPGCTPERKGPFEHERAAEVLREFFAARPKAFISVVTFGHDGPSFQDAPECLMMLDGRSKSVAMRHIESSKAAHALGVGAYSAAARVTRLIQEAIRLAPEAELYVAAEIMSASSPRALAAQESGL